MSGGSRPLDLARSQSMALACENAVDLFAKKLSYRLERVIFLMSSRSTAHRAA